MSTCNRSPAGRQSWCVKVMSTRKTNCKGIGHRGARGAVAIEFAALFILFFTLLYGIMAFSLPMLLTLTFKNLSADAARSAVKVDPSVGPEAYKALISQQITNRITSSWLPDDWYDGNCAAPSGDLTWQALPAYGDQAVFGYWAEEAITDSHSRYLLQVCIQRKYNRTGSAGETAIIPIVEIGGISIPPLPEKGDGQRLLQGRTTIHL